MRLSSRFLSISIKEDCWRQREEKKEAARKKSKKERAIRLLRSNHNLAEQCLRAQFFLFKEN